MKISIILLCGLMLFSPFSYAFLPVIDVTEISDILKQLDELKKQSDVMSSQLSQAKQLTNDAEGHYGYGEYLNSSSDLKDQQWSPDSWDDALKDASGGNDARYQQLTEQYNESHTIMSQSDYASVSSDQEASDYVDQTNSNRAATVNANHAFDDINTRLQEVYDLTQKIENTDNTKSAVDLNNRITAELAYIQLQEMKMQAVTNLQMSQQQSILLSDKTQEAQFDELPPE